jgi:RNA polymerase sigma-32 factor
MARRRKGKKSAAPDAAGRPGAGDGERDGLDGEGASDGDGDDDDSDDPEVLVAEVIDPDDDDSDDGDIDGQLDRIVDAEIGGKKSRKPSKSSASRVELIKHDPLSAYVQETKRYPLLSREDEHELAVRLVEAGDTGAARRLIEANLRLVVKIAYEYRRAHRNLLDLIQEGNIGLMQAVKKYDPYRGVKLSSYAAWWIRAYILKFILNNWRLVKIGTTQAQRKLFFNLRKEKERLEQLGFTPTPALLAENLDVKEKDVIEMEKRMAAPDASLDAPVGTDDDGGARTRMDFLPSDSSMRPDVEVANTEFQDLLKSKLEIFGETLKGREETIFRERLLTDTPLTLQEIGDRYGVSRERARQLEKRLLGRLRTYLEKELGTEVDIGAQGGD